MSVVKSFDSVINLAEATRVAKACEHVDINSTVQQCPASQPQIFVVPMRYALSEEPASHPAFQPGVATQSHPMAVRQLRIGFVYVWQGKGPLQRYAMAENGLLQSQDVDEDDTVIVAGSLSGIALDKHQDAWMLYSEIPLNKVYYTQLGEPAIRAKRMRRLDLRQVANTLQAPHCIPLNDAKQVMAELLPETYERAIAIDYQQNAAVYREAEQQLAQQVLKETNPVTLKILINAWIDAKRWNNERSAVAARNPEVKADSPPAGEWSAVPWAPFRATEVLELAHVHAKGLYSVLACLDDDLGVLRDINHEQELVESRHEQWQADNSLRLSIGGFVRSLITEDTSEVVGMLSYRYRDQDIELTHEQAQMLLDARTRLEQLAKERYTASIRRGTTHSNQEADTRLVEIHLREQAAVLPVRGFVPLEFHDDIIAMVRDYQESKVNSLKNKHASDKVEQYIDLPRMNQWLDETAPAHFSHLQQRHETLYADRGQYLQRHHSGTWCVDYQDPDHRQWLDILAMACLSAQCLRKVGAEQYADYVRSTDEGALRQLFFGWDPTLEAAVNMASRAAELMAALGIENQANAMAAMGKALGPQGLKILADLSDITGDVTGLWNGLIKRLGASLLLLSSKTGEPLRGALLAIMVAVRAGNQIGLRLISQGTHQVLQQFGKVAEDLTHWSVTTGKAIGLGQVAKIVDSPAVKGSGGLVAITALLVNSWNASHYLAQADVMEGMDRQRINDTWSATLYAGAALVAVVDSQMSKESGFMINSSAAPMRTLLGGIIGGISAVAAFQEFKSLQLQLESAQVSTEPWLQFRQYVVGGQIMAFSAQAINGAAFTLRAITGGLSAEMAMLRYSLWMGPINYLIAVLGVFYLVAWYLQQTPMQNFLDNCCWSRPQASDLSPVSFEDQQKELNRLYEVLYIPRISFELAESGSAKSTLQSGDVNKPIKYLTVDLPGAEPSNTYLDIAMIGDPIDTLAMRERIKNGVQIFSHKEPMQDIGEYWINSSSCEWIPYQQGQGLRLSGPFSTVPSLFGSQPTTVSLRLRYRSPLTSMLGVHSFIGGDRGVAFTLNAATGVVALRNDPTPELDRARRYSMGDQECSVFLQPGMRR